MLVSKASCFRIVIGDSRIFNLFEKRYIALVSNNFLYNPVDQVFIWFYNFYRISKQQRTADASDL